MANKIRRAIYFLLSVIAIVIIGVIGTWAYILFSPTAMTHAWVANSPWPIACSTRGCVTTKDWARQTNLAEKFSHLTNLPKRTPAEALTTVLRQHLLAHAFLKSPVTLADARRYREEVLKLTDTSLIQSSVGLSASEYDQYVVLPFIEQEALRQSMHIDATDDLYKALSKERFILLLPWHFKWDASKAVVVEK